MPALGARAFRVSGHPFSAGRARPSAREVAALIQACALSQPGHPGGRRAKSEEEYVFARKHARTQAHTVRTERDGEGTQCAEWRGCLPRLIPNSDSECGHEYVSFPFRRHGYAVCWAPLSYRGRVRPVWVSLSYRGAGVSLD
jgi:hypothetical protein